MRKTRQTWSSKAPDFTLTKKCIPASAEKLLNVSDGSCLWSHQVGQGRCTTKLQVLQKVTRAWPAAEGKTTLQRKRVAWHRTWQGSCCQKGRRLNEKQEGFPRRPVCGWPLSWDHSTEVEGGWHHAAVAETQRPGYLLGLHFDNILNFLLVFIYWLFSPEISQDC